MYLNIINIVCDCWLIKVNLRDICLPHQHDESKRTLKQKLSKAKKRENIAHQQKALREAETELATATVGSIVLPSLPPLPPSPTRIERWHVVSFIPEQYHYVIT